MSLEIVNLYPYRKNNVYTIYVRNKLAVNFISGTPKTKINSFDLSSQKKKKRMRQKRMRGLHLFAK